MADEPRRIIDLTETQLVGSGDYLALDSADGGTKKVKASYFSGGSENYMWGGIQGDIADQTDLYEYLEQIPNKADIDGYYEDMSVGSAEQLLSNTYEPDSTPYLYRTSGGSLEIGNRVYEDAIVGASIPWNQLAPNVLGAWYRNGVNVSLTDGEYTITPIADASSLKAMYIDGASILNHVIFCSAKLKISDAQYGVFTGVRQPNNAMSVSARTTSSTYELCQCIGKITDAQDALVVRISNGAPTTVTANAKDVIFCDLTLALGSTIADYAYTLETSEAGSGIAWLKSQGFFTKDYYAYNAGGIQSVKTSAKKVVGFNQWDEEWEVGNIDDTTGIPISDSGKIRSKNFCNILPSTIYYAKSPQSIRVLFYDTGYNFIGETVNIKNETFTSPEGSAYFKIRGANAYGSTYNNDICINFHWDGERDGEYEAYVEHTYPLDSDLELRGIAKLVDGKIKYDGDLYASDGSVTKKYSAYNLGNLNWSAEGNNVFISAGIVSVIKPPASNGDIANILNARYLSNSSNAVANGSVDKAIGVSTGGYLRIRDTAYSDASALKTALSGIYCVFERLTATTVSADPYTNPQWVDNWGTEEFVDTRDVPVPVGHDSRYLPDLKAKLESAPNNPSTNGKYFLQYQNGEATYVPVPSEVPQTPSEDGTYVLKATVSSGTATLSWVAEE